MTSSDDRPGIAWWILGAATLVRLAVAAGTPLFEDEAYYWAWSRRLAAGYFDHPPLVAWVLRLGTGIAGDSPLGVRLGPVLCGLAAGIAMLRSAGRLDGASAARRAAWLAALIPLFTGTFVVATPDAPLLACAAWLLHATGRAIDTDEPRWWLAAGGLLGLSLLAKYTAVLIPAGVVLGCIGYRPLRAQLRRPGPWLAIAIALVVALPMIRWNAAHDWVSFRFQLGHGFGRPSGSVLQRELSYVGSQFALFSPVLLLLAARAGVRSAAYGARPWRGMLAAVSAFVFAFFALSALRRRPEGNWPALAYPAAAVLLATSALVRERARLWRVGLGVAAVMSVAAVVAASVPLPFVPARRDPLRKSRGWEVLADSVAAATARQSQAPGRWHLAANRYQDAALLQWHLAGHPEVTSLNLGGRPNQYDLWPRFAEAAAPGDGLLLALPERADAATVLSALRPHFDRLEEGPLVEQRWRESVVRRHRLWLLHGWRGSWPVSPGTVPPAPRPG